MLSHWFINFSDSDALLLFWWSWQIIFVFFCFKKQAFLKCLELSKMKLFHKKKKKKNWHIFGTKFFIFSFLLLYIITFSYYTVHAWLLKHKVETDWWVQLCRTKHFLFSQTVIIVEVSIGSENFKKLKKFYWLFYWVLAKNISLKENKFVKP